MTLTLTTVNAARRVVFVAAGGGAKADMLFEVLMRRNAYASAPGGLLPCQRVETHGAAVEWMVDQATATKVLAALEQ